jgi:hypothetical protein
VLGGGFLFATAQCLFTSTFTPQTVRFQSQHYRRVGGFGLLTSGEDVDLFNRLRPAKAAGSGRSITTRRGSHLAHSGLEKRLGDKRDKGIVGVRIPRASAERVS